MAVKAEVMDHLERREDKESTAFGPDQENLWIFQEAEKQNTPHDPIHYPDASPDETREVSPHVGERAQELDTHRSISPHVENQGSPEVSGRGVAPTTKPLWMLSASFATTSSNPGARSTIEVRMPKFGGDITKFEL
jgi:hypothetical protein